MKFALTILVCLAACGGATTEHDGGNDGANDARAFDAGTTDAGREDASDASPEDAGRDANVETATRLLSWNDGEGLRVVAPEGSSLDGYIRGGDFDEPIWASDDVWSWYMLHITEGGSPTEDFARVTLPTLPDRNGAQATVLKMALLADAPGTTVEQIEFLEQQSAGRAGEIDDSFPAHTLVEPVFYQRQWIKFSPDTRTRAATIGEQDFYQIFWEMKAEPDYRLRVQLSYSDAIGLVIRTHDDVLENAEPVHVDSGPVAVGTIEMAPEDIALGWHLFEVWVDRTRGDESRWRVRFNGIDVLNYTGTLMGESGNIMGTAMLVQLYSDVTVLGSMPYYQLIDDMEIWDAPPRDAFPSR